ncbi:MAG: hypothetical protein A2W75_03050 [Nitrospinae bacterium RIFCSPLOWO2_12_39_15]|nr:MAG: hypothetical protein A2W75_03050 [Nitrospinae bacterium RIFCSPLOWO2_12_39_15]
MFKGTAGRIIANTIWLFTEKFLNRLITFALIVYLVRYLGSLNFFGKLNFAMSFVCLFLILTDIGISTLVVRNGAGNKDDLAIYFGSAILIVMPMGIFAYAVISSVSLLFSVPEDTWTMILLIAGYYIAVNVGVIYLSVFRAYVIALITS